MKHSFSHLLGISLLAAAVAFPVVADARGSSGGGGRGGGGGGGRSAAAASSGAKAAAAASRSSMAIARASTARGAAAASRSSNLGSSFRGGANMNAGKMGGGKMGGGGFHYSGIHNAEPAIRSYSSGTTHSSSYYPYYLYSGHHTPKAETTTADGKIQVAVDDIQISVSPACVFMKSSSNAEVRTLGTDVLNDKIEDVVNSEEFKTGKVPENMDSIDRHLWNAALACK